MFNTGSKNGDTGEQLRLQHYIVMIWSIVECCIRYFGYDIVWVMQTLEITTLPLSFFVSLCLSLYLSLSLYIYIYIIHLFKSFYTNSTGLSMSTALCMQFVSFRSILPISFTGTKPIMQLSQCRWKTPEEHRYHSDVTASQWAQWYLKSPASQFFADSFA